MPPRRRWSSGTGRVDSQTSVGGIQVDADEAPSGLQAERVCTHLVGAPGDIFSADRERFARTLDVVKYNFSFHDRRFSIEEYKRFACELRELGLKAVLKASGLATHENCLRNSEEWWPRLHSAYQSMSALGVLAGVLWQCPPSLQCSPETLDCLCSLCKRLADSGDMRHIFEFRHKSWYESKKVLDTLAENKCCLAWLNLNDPRARGWVDSEGWSLCRQTTDFVFLQCHGSDGRAVGSYSNEFLRIMGDKLPHGLDAIVLFCQVDVPSHAWSNATAFRNSLNGSQAESSSMEVEHKSKRVWKPKGKKLSKVAGQVVKMTARLVLLDVQGRTGVLGRGHLRSSHRRNIKIGDTISDLQIEAVERNRLWLSLHSSLEDSSAASMESQDAASDGAESLAALLQEIDMLVLQGQDDDPACTDDGGNHGVLSAASSVVSAIVTEVTEDGLAVSWGEKQTGLLLWQHVWGSIHAQPQVGDSISVVVELGGRSREQQLHLAFPGNLRPWAPVFE